jgi:hypothetical protein
LAGEQVLAAALGPGEAVGVDLAEAVVEGEQILEKRRNSPDDAVARNA